MNPVRNSQSNKYLFKDFKLLKTQPKISNGAKKAFTIIELLIVMAIIVVISGLSLANWRGGEKQYALLRAANKLSQDLRRAEEMAMSAREFQGQIPKGGYGVYFKIQEKDHYVLFADLNGNYSYDSGSDGLIEDVKIERDIQISQLSASPLTIVFTPPDPTVTIKPDASTATITLAIETDPTKARTIRVNKSGLVYIESCLTCYPDADRDGYYSTSGSQICGVWSCSSGYSAIVGNDCNDNNGSVYPGTACDGANACKYCQTDGVCGGSTPNTFWGANQYGCTGVTKRCYSGSCVTCGGYLYSDGCDGCAGQGGLTCWYRLPKSSGNYGKSCDYVCSVRGCVAANWNDDVNCTVIKYFGGCAYIWSPQKDSYAPYYYEYSFSYCGRRAAGTNQSCSQEAPGPAAGIYLRVCACNY